VTDDLLANVEFSSPRPGIVQMTHAAEICDGEPCVIHSPSDHHMADWPTTFRSDRAMLCPTHKNHALVLTERICQHNCGHPDPDSLTWLRLHDPLGLGAWGTHGCCRCCVPGETGEVDA